MGVTCEGKPAGVQTIQQIRIEVRDNAGAARENRIVEANRAQKRVGAVELGNVRRQLRI